MRTYWVYILKCNDDSFYTGHTADLEFRLGQHTVGLGGSWTASRLPIELVFSQQMPDKNSAFLAERQIKGWSRAKKQALIDENWDLLVWLAKNFKERVGESHPDAQR